MFCQFCLFEKDFWTLSQNSFLFHLFDLGNTEAAPVLQSARLRHFWRHHWVFHTQKSNAFHSKTNTLKFHIIFVNHEKMHSSTVSSKKKKEGKEERKVGKAREGKEKGKEKVKDLSGSQDTFCHYIGHSINHLPHHHHENHSFEWAQRSC